MGTAGIAMRLLSLRTVVVATDLTPSSDTALAAAHALAALAGAALHVVHVVPASSSSSDAPAAHALDHAAGDVRAALRRARVAEGEARVHVIPGAPAETIRAFADRMSADVIVLGPHRRHEQDATGRPLGSTARDVAEHAYMPCLVAARRLRLPLQRVLVPIDFSDTARGALLVGLSWASGLRAHDADHPPTLTALHVAGRDEEDAPGELERQLEVLRTGPGGWAGVDIRGRVEHGADAARAIERHAVDHQVDLVVMGTRGLGADDDGGLGSVSTSVVLDASVPTLLVPPAVWRVHGMPD